jgi:hypothetical protein
MATARRDCADYHHSSFASAKTATLAKARPADMQDRAGLPLPPVKTGCFANAFWM